MRKILGLIAILALIPFAANTFSGMGFQPHQTPTPLPATLYGYVEIVCQSNGSAYPAPPGLNVSLRDPGGGIIGSTLTGANVTSDNGYQLVVGNYTGTAYLFVEEVNVSSVNISSGAVVEANLTVNETNAPSKPGGPWVDPPYSPSPTVMWNASQDDLGVDHYVLVLRDANNTVLYNVSTVGTSWSVPSPLQDGVYTVYVSAVDKSCNTGAAASLAFIVDTEPPAILDFAPANNSVLGDGDVWINLTVEETLSGVGGIFDVDNQTVLPSVESLGGSLWRVYANVSLQEGEHVIEYTVWDGAGHTVSGMLLVTVDLSPPEISLSSGPAGVWVNTQSPSFVFTISDAVSAVDPGSVAVTLDGGAIPGSAAYDPGTGQLDVSLSGVGEGWHLLTVYAEDLAGNLEAYTVSFGVDVSQPTLVDYAPGNGEVVPVNNICVYAVVSDGLSGVDPASIHFYVNGVEVPASYDPGTGRIEYCGYFADGAYGVVVELADSAGNPLTVRINFTVDSGAPVIHVYEPAQHGYYNVTLVSVNLSVHDDNGVDSAMVYLDGQLVASYDGGAADWPYVGQFNLSEGVHTLYVIANDTLGNSGSINITFTIDTSPPWAQWINPAEPGTVFSSGDVCLNLTLGDTVSGIDWSSLAVLIDGVPVDSSNIAYDSSTGGVGVCLTLSDGAHVVTVQVSDMAGNVLASSTTFTVDTIAPSVWITVPGPGLYSNSTIHIRGYALDSLSGVDPGSLSLLIDGVAVGFEYNATDGSVYAVVQLGDGEHNITLIASDAAGNTGQDTVVFTVDSTPPAISIISPANNSVLGDVVVHIAAMISDGLSGVDETSVSVKVNGTDVPYTLTGGLLEAYINLSEGVYILSITVSDMAGNNATATTIFMIDLEYPSITVDPPPGSVLPVSDTVLEVYVEDDTSVASVDVYLDGALLASYTPGTSSFYVAVNASLDDGEHNLTVLASDASGKTSASTSLFTVDTVPPGVLVTAPVYTNSSNVSILVNASDTTTWIQEILIYVDGGLMYEYTPPSSLQSVVLAVDLTMGEGVHEVEVHVIDGAGHVGIVVSNVTVDTNPPVLVVYSPVDGGIYDTSTVYVNVSIGDDNGLYMFSLLLPNGTKLDIPLNGEPSAGLVIPLELGDGSYTIVASTTDLAGNTVSQSIAFTVDTSPPALSVVSPIDGGVYDTGSLTMVASLTDAVSGVNNDSIRVLVDGLEIAFSYDPSLGLLTALLDLDDGVHTIVLEASDHAGNTAVLSLAITVDTSPPAAIVQAPEYLNDTQAIIQVEVSDSLSGVAQVLVYADWQLVYNWTGAPSGNASFTVDIQLGEGTHTILVEAFDVAGNQANATTLVTIDLTPPSLSSIDPSNETVLDVAGGDTVSIIALIVDSGGLEGVEATVNGVAAYVGITQTSSGVYQVEITWTPGEAGYGLEELVVRAYDHAGNTVSWHIVYYADSGPPVVTVASPSIPLGGTYVSPTGVLALSIEAWDDDTWVSNISLTIDGTPVELSSGSPGLWVANLSLQEGAHYAVIQAEDAAGHIVTGSIVLIVDLTPPIIASASPDNLTVATDGALAFSAQVIEASGYLGNVTVSLDGVEIPVTMTSLGSTLFLVSANTTLSPGLHSLCLTVQDEAGYVASHRILIVIDQEAPAILAEPQYVLAEPGQRIVITVSDDALDAFGLYNIQPLVSTGFTVYSFSDGIITIMPTSPLPIGEPVRVEVSVADPAGRESIAVFYAVNSTPVEVSWTLEPGYNMVSVPGGVVYALLQNALGQCGTAGNVSLYSGWNLTAPGETLAWPVLRVYYNGSSPCQTSFTAYQLPPRTIGESGADAIAPASQIPLEELSSGDGLVIVYTFNPETGAWETGAYTWAGPVGSIQELLPGQGYLVWVSGAGSQNLEDAEMIHYPANDALLFASLAAAVLTSGLAVRGKRWGLPLLAALLLATTPVILPTTYAGDASVTATPGETVYLEDGTATLSFTAVYNDSYQSLAALEIRIDGDAHVNGVVFLMDGHEQNVTTIENGDALVYYTDNLQPANGHLTINVSLTGSENATIHWRFTVQPMEQLSPNPPITVEGNTKLTVQHETPDTEPASNETTGVESGGTPLPVAVAVLAAIGIAVAVYMLHRRTSGGK